MTQTELHTQFLIRRETADEHLAQGATFGDDLDLVHSPVDGGIVTVAVRDGRHVCWRCFEGFNQGEPRLRRQEVWLGFSRVMLHAGCESAPTRANVSADLRRMREVLVRRGLQNVEHASQRIAEAAKVAKNKIFG